MATQQFTKLPAWVNDIIKVRAQATGMTYDEALLASLDIRALDPQSETLGWAVAQGKRSREVARRTHYSKSTVESAAARYSRRSH